ncbi:MAG TPA: SDR family NAD(P)-dependent oxidoreductase [Stellaceae bacterium]|jgi:NAD(P)-dependent dehydrogenase (short-subunit alcohol dehydrogenase family)|nr:SDR family NAD(P)-dependent oxidoreductase [Stellaceae bacterium]
MTEIALIVGTGSGLSASLARLFAKNGMKVALASRKPQKLDALAREIGARHYACDASSRSDVPALFKSVTADLGAPDLVVYNPSYRTRGPLIELDPVEVEKALMVTCYGGFLVGQAAARQMLERGHGSILFTGASASVKGYAQSAPFAMGKFGLRGLAQSMARELQPKNIHVAHFVIDGGIRQQEDPRSAQRGNDGMLEPDAIAETYLHIHRQHRSAWTWEVELRPWVETF